MDSSTESLASASDVELPPPLDLSHLYSETTKHRTPSKMKKYYRHFQIPGIGNLAGGMLLAPVQNPSPGALVGCPCRGLHAGRAAQDRARADQPTGGVQDCLTSASSRTTRWRPRSRSRSGGRRRRTIRTGRWWWSSWPA